MSLVTYYQPTFGEEVDRMPLSLSQTGVELLDSCRELRALCKSVGSGRGIERGVAILALEHYRKIRHLAEDAQLNAMLVSRRDSYAQPLRFRTRHISLHYVTNVNDAWIYEVETMPDLGIDESELVSIRTEGLKYFARAQRAEESNPDVRHPLVGPLPLVELAERLNTPQLMHEGANSMFRRERKYRKRQLADDCQRLAAVMLLLANAGQPGPRVFELSFTLAVCQACTALS